MEQTNHEYIKRINRVIDHIHSNLDKSFRLKELAKIACFSDFHFHRIFGAIMGETVNSFTNRLRLEKCARLLRDSKLNITEIALECGFSSSQTLARSFHNTYGVSPREYRKSSLPKIRKNRKEWLLDKRYILPMTEDQKRAAFPISIKEFPAWDIAYIRILNSFEGDRALKAYRRLINWAKDQGLFESGRLIGMSIDDPSVCPAHLCRYEAGITINRHIEPFDDISTTSIPGRTYAVTRVSGDIRAVATAWEYLYRGWIIKSRYEPVHAASFEIFLDKEKALDWSHFELELCLPIKRFESI